MALEISAPDLSPLRTRFPSLARRAGDAPCVFADAPGGTQVPDSVIEAMAAYMRTSNANSGGAFITSVETDEVVAGARRAAADFLGCEPREVVFGHNMTTLAFALSRSLARSLKAEDEVVVTSLDHDANIAPCVSAAEDAGATFRWVDVRTDDCTLDLDSLERALSPRTRIVAFTLASNATGSLTPADDIVRRARASDAIVIADAVHLAQHRAIDVRALGADVLFCSPYKFFGPHLGIMFGSREVLDTLRPYKVRPAQDHSPGRWETGTMSFEALAGLIATIGYLAGVGREFCDVGAGGRREQVVAGMRAIEAYEAALTARFLEALPSLAGVTLYGIADRSRARERTPTFAVRVGDDHPREVAARLAERGIFVWDGNYYALAIMQRLGLEGSGGAVRVGFCHYNTTEEVDRVLDELRNLSRP
jgi:cysteine desulfurase family protein (TIGR01976 family)